LDGSQQASVRGAQIGLVVNRGSGAALGADPLPPVLDALAARGVVPLTVEDSSCGVREAIDSALAKGVRRLLVFGGDGTIAAAAHALAGTDRELAVLPGGTMNLLAKDVGLPLDLEEAVDIALDGEARAIDVGVVNGQVFLVSSFLGLPTRLQKEREAQRGRLWKPLVYVRLALTAIVAVLRYPPLRLRVDLGDGRGSQRVATRAVNITNNLMSGAGPEPLRKQRLDAGELGLYIVRPMSLWRLLGLSIAIALGKFDAHPGLVRVVGDRFIVHSGRRKMHVMNDGELHLLSTPLVFTIRRRALRVVGPAEA
jgi:diacylglycerol kinase family enzyme